MSCKANTPSFKYVLVENLVITHNAIPYPVKDMFTNKKYIIWNVDSPNLLQDSNIRPDESLLQYLIVINDNGVPTVLTHDNITISFDAKINGFDKTEYNALKEKVDDNIKKYNLMSETVDGMEKVIGKTEELEDGTIVYNLNKLKTDSEGYNLKIKEIQTKIDDKFEEIKPILLNDIVEYLRSISEYKLSLTNVKEDVELTTDELALVNTNKTNMNNKLSKLKGSLDSLKAILVDIGDTTKAQIINDAKTQLTNLNNALISVCDSALLNKKIDGNEKSNIIQKSYELSNYVTVVQNTCNNITVNGLGGVIYSIENELLINKDKTSSTIKELERNDKSLSEKYSKLEQTVGGISSKVSSVESDFNNLQIGGRNLLIGSDFSTVTQYSNLTVENGVVTMKGKLGGSNNFRLILSAYAINNIRNKQITGKMLGFCSSAITYGETNPWIGGELTVRYKDGTGSWFTLWGAKLFPTSVSTSWIETEKTFKVEDKDIESAVVNFYIRDAEGTVQFKSPKFEIGNKATDWSPAPEDIDEKFTNYSTTTQMNSAINQKADEINSRVSKTETKVDNMKIGGSNLMNKSDDFSDLAYSGAVKVIEDAIFVEEWGFDGIPITTTGGTATIKCIKPNTPAQKWVEGDEYVVSVWVKNTSTTYSIRINANGLKQANSVTIAPGEQTRAIIKGIGDGTKNMQINIAGNLVTDNLSMILARCQIEIGNKETPWNLSTQDILDNIDDSTKMESADGEIVYIKDQVSEINQNVDNITNKVSNIETEFAEDGSITALKSEVSKFQQLSNKFTMEFFEKIENSDGAIQDILSYINFSSDGIILGQNSYPIKLVISKDRIKFVSDDGKQLAYFSDNKLLIEDSEILNTLIISNYGFIPSSNGGLTIGAVK